MNRGLDKHWLRRIRSWGRSPPFYAQKAREKVFGIGATFFGNQREAYPVGSFDWLALTEARYGGLQLTRDCRGGDRMSPHYHNYGRCYAQFLKPFIAVPCAPPLILVEVGIFRGSGLAIWCDLFPNARVIGLDIDLSNFEGRRKRLEAMGAFRNNAPELFAFDQLNEAGARSVLQHALRGGA
jgi:hypothetical protein